MTSRIREEAAEKAQIRLPIYITEDLNKIKVQNSYLLQDFYMLPLLQASEHRLKFGQI